MALELEVNYFCRGILLGLVDIGIDTIRLCSQAGHAAALEAFKHLQEANDEQFDIRFAIILHPIYRESGDWANAVSFQLVSGLAIYSGGEYITQVRRDYLDRWFESQPGSRDFWKRCATIYRDTFRTHLRTHPEPRSA